MNRSEGEKLDYIAKRLDTIIVILLARYGLRRNEIAKILDVSEKTIERLLAGNLTQIKPSRN